MAPSRLFPSSFVGSNLCFVCGAALDRSMVGSRPWWRWRICRSFSDAAVSMTGRRPVPHRPLKWHCSRNERRQKTLLMEISEPFKIIWKKVLDKAPYFFCHQTQRLGGLGVQGLCLDFEFGPFVFCGIFSCSLFPMHFLLASENSESHPKTVAWEQVPCGNTIAGWSMSLFLGDVRFLVMLLWHLSCCTSKNASKSMLLCVYAKLAYILYPVHPFPFVAKSPGVSFGFPTSSLYLASRLQKRDLCMILPRSLLGKWWSNPGPIHNLCAVARWTVSSAGCEIWG